MKLIIVTSLTPPPKKKWSSSILEDRNGWGEFFEALINWFCISNGFRTENSVDFLILKEHLKVIRFKGKYLRYLSPQLRSAASLIYKAWVKEVKNEWKESTPGVTVRIFESVSDYLQENNKTFEKISLEGEKIKYNHFTNLIYDPQNLLKLHIPDRTYPFKHIAQAIIWELNTPQS